MNNIRFSEFVKTMDDIGKGYAALAKEKKIGLMYSGGVDSTAILLSLMDNHADITLVHILFFNPPTSYSIFCEGMTDDEDHIRDKKDASHSGTNLYFYSSHPLMIDLFKRYKEDVGDIFFRKRLTEFYVKEKLGRSYNSLVREICRENKDRMEPTMKRFFMYVENKKKKPDDGLENASC